MLDYELVEALDNVALTYGWKNTRKLWIETRGFTTSLETAMKDYKESGIIPRTELLESIQKLKDYPDPYDDVLHEINFEIANDVPKTAGTSIEEITDMYGETALESLLKTQWQEQRRMDYKNASEFERVEAEVADDYGEE
jgi:hypothetical protein